MGGAVTIFIEFPPLNYNYININTGIRAASLHKFVRSLHE